MPLRRGLACARSDGAAPPVSSTRASVMAAAFAGLLSTRSTTRNSASGREVDSGVSSTIEAGGAAERRTAAASHVPL